MGRNSIITSSRNAVSLFGLAFALASCGGGGGSSSSINRAPQFSSASKVSVAENSTGSFYSAEASDPEGSTVVISIAGGADGPKFSLDGSGALTFVKSPNFDQPTDANHDNIYEVTLSAVDPKGASSTLALQVTVTNEHEGVATSLVANGFGPDAVITARTDKSGLLIASQDGSVSQIDPATDSISAVGNVFQTGETGRILAISHFNKMGVVMIDLDNVGVILRTIPLSDSLATYSSDKLIAGANTENARGALYIGGDGYLYAALGDPNGDNAQNSSSGLGKLFRVQIDPYCGASVGTYCFSAGAIGDGLHAPAGGGGYQQQSFLLDRGTDQQEEVDFYNQAASPLDFGWPYREGTYDRTANPPAAINGPSLTYGYGDDFYSGEGMTGAAYYTGAIASLNDKILMTDQSGKIFDFPASFLSDGTLHSAQEMENRTADFAPDSGTMGNPEAIVLDKSGRIFVLDDQGQLFGTS
ncbi:hypothetical protein GRI58_03055 [Porphyrobacter algicida]|uniref:Cadherin domain-containing protein n=1 Tax=Qipengyuania algicida TaxID=1836209 RepID=A0A845AFQ7_9SPHN|nr:hypothetical protein [Qipengyuania algicida]MXP27801.1 hypothetical protein [Qipengyuania algicida]